MVSKAELLEQCWPETFVSESALTRCLARLRKAVQPTPTAPPVIATRHRQGYRFVAEVTVLAQAPHPATVPAAPLVPPDTPPALARDALSTAIAMYRAMDMTFWLPQAEAALVQEKGS